MLKERVNVGAVAVRHDPTSAALVRRAIADDLHALGVCTDSIEDVVLVASELVGNAVVHDGCADPGEALDISWEITSGAVLLRVGDHNHAVPTVRAVPASSTRGRGMAIVAAIALEWGVERVVDGKQVWARVPIVAA